MAEQKQFDFNRAAKLNTLECAICPVAGVKGLLKALDGFARNDPSCTVTLNRIALSMGVSTSTVRRSVRMAQDAGLLRVEGEPQHGRANRYTIDWKAVFELPTGASPKRRCRAAATPVNLGGVPFQSARGPLSTWEGSPVNLGGVSRTDPTDQRTDTDRKTQDGGGGVMVKESKTRIEWGYIDPEFPDREQERLLAIAREHGLIGSDEIDELRLRSACLTARDRPPEYKAGWFIRCATGRLWSKLNPKRIQTVFANMLGRPVVLKESDLRKVRMDVR